MIQQKNESFCIKEVINIVIKTIGDNRPLNHIKYKCLQILLVKIHLYIKNTTFLSILFSMLFLKKWITILNENISEPLGNEFSSLLFSSN